MGKKVVKYSLAFVLALSVILSVYSLYHYSGNTDSQTILQDPKKPYECRHTSRYRRFQAY
ncbi:MAG: hypothetical protein QJR05_10775 [Thermoanaerobacterium sp.]|nr:hypothetical protein [Thermoanaerobacterium sp.]